MSITPWLCQGEGRTGNHEVDRLVYTREKVLTARHNGNTQIRREAQQGHTRGDLLQALRAFRICQGPYPAATLHALQNTCMLEGLLMPANRSEEHTSELQSLMRISYAVFCLKIKIPQTHSP